MEVGVTASTLTRDAAPSARVLTNHLSTPHDNPIGVVAGGGVGMVGAPPQPVSKNVRPTAAIVCRKLTGA
jgi:hypothetical protein